jgi:hypothetical protein
MSQLCSDSSGSTPLPHSHQTVSMPLNKPLKRLLFRSPLPKGEGIKQALAWNRKQLLDLQRLWELCRQHRIDAGLLPMTRPPLMISDDALGVENRTSTAMAMPPSSQTPLLTSHLDSQCRAPFQPTAWRNLTSVVRRPCHWQVASSMLSTKTVKILLRFRQHTTMEMSSPVSSPKALASPLLLLPKGWVYAVEDVNIKTEAEVVNPSSYLMLGAPLTCLKHKRQLDDQLADPHHQYRRVLNITEALPSSHSTYKKMAVKHRRIISGLLRFSLLTITVHVTDYHWDRHLYFVIHSHHAQTMTHR